MRLALRQSGAERVLDQLGGERGLDLSPDHRQLPLARGADLQADGELAGLIGFLVLAVERKAELAEKGFIHRAVQPAQWQEVILQLPQCITGLPFRQRPDRQRLDLAPLARPGNTQADADGAAVDDGPIEIRPAQGFELTPPGPGSAVNEINRTHPRELQGINRAIDQPAQMGGIQFGRGCNNKPQPRDGAASAFSA